LTLPSEVEAIKKPGLWVCAEVDRMLPPQKVKQVAKILTKNGVEHEMKVYPHTKHGFAIRGNENREVVKIAKMGAIQDCAQYLKKHLQ
jgi:dienelactone hydrolase